MSGNGNGKEAQPTKVVAETVVAEKILLVGKDGKIRAEFGLALDGSPLLAFLDENGKNRIGLGILPNGVCALGFYGSDGMTCRVSMLLSDSGAGVDLFNAAGELMWSTRGIPDHVGGN
jgi:hypothetical protein